MVARVLNLISVSLQKCISIFTSLLNGADGLLIYFAAVSLVLVYFKIIKPLLGGSADFSRKERGQNARNSNSSTELSVRSRD